MTHRITVDIHGLQEAVKVEAFNKKFWFLCQHWLAARQGPQQRFRDLITSIPEIRFVAASLKKVPAEKLSFLFKVILLMTHPSMTHRTILGCAANVPHGSSATQAARGASSCATSSSATSGGATVGGSSSSSTAA